MRIMRTMRSILGISSGGQIRNGEVRAMKAGRWEGEFTDIDGHRARVLFTITATGESIRGTFEMILSTEDEAERYEGKLTGTASGEAIALQLHLESDTVLTCQMQLREPAAHAEQAVFGTVGPARALNFGGGTLMAWKFRTP